MLGHDGARWAVIIELVTHTTLYIGFGRFNEIARLDPASPPGRPIHMRRSRAKPPRRLARVTRARA